MKVVTYQQILSVKELLFWSTSKVIIKITGTCF